MTGLELQYLCDNTDTSTNDKQLQPWFQIINNGTTSVPLSALTIRYFYTKDVNVTQVFNCDYAQVGNGNVTATFNTYTGTNADEYLQIGFTAGAGSLAPGKSTGQIQARINGNGFPVLTQTNDYSFDPTKTTFTDWDHVTLYYNGTLVWGIEP